MVTIRMIRGPEAGKTLRIPHQEGSSLRIGRTEESDIVIPDLTMSRDHARLVLARHGDEVRLHIEDTRSTSGVYVNGDRTVSSVLQAGDEIRLGGILFVVEEAEPGGGEAL